MDDIFSKVRAEVSLKEFFESSKRLFVYSDRWLLKGVTLTGTVVFYRFLENGKHLFGLDDSTGCMFCVLD